MALRLKTPLPLSISRISSFAHVKATYTWSLLWASTVSEGVARGNLSGHVELQLKVS